MSVKFKTCVESTNVSQSCVRLCLRLRVRMLFDVNGLQRYKDNFVFYANSAHPLQVWGPVTAKSVCRNVSISYKDTNVVTCVSFA